VRIDPLDSRAYFLTGAAECWLGNTGRSEEQLRHAVEINPSCFQAYGQLGSVLYLDGRPKEAIDMMMQARRLSPHDQQLFFVLTEIGMAWLMLGQAEDALAFARQAIMRRSGYWYAHVVRVCALRQLGRVDEAVGALADLYDTKCQFRLEYIDWLPFRDRSWNALLKTQVAL
jgi:Flp pilus assembly protein TadD